MHLVLQFIYYKIIPGAGLKVHTRSRDPLYLRTYRNSLTIQYQN